GNDERDPNGIRRQPGRAARDRRQRGRGPARRRQRPDGAAAVLRGSRGSDRRLGLRGDRSAAGAVARRRPGGRAAGLRRGGRGSLMRLYETPDAIRGLLADTGEDGELAAEQLDRLTALE